MTDKGSNSNYEKRHYPLSRKNAHLVYIINLPLSKFTSKRLKIVTILSDNLKAHKHCTSYNSELLYMCYNAFQYIAAKTKHAQVNSLEQVQDSTFFYNPKLVTTMMVSSCCDWCDLLCVCVCVCV